MIMKQQEHNMPSFTSSSSTTAMTMLVMVMVTATTVTLVMMTSGSVVAATASSSQLKTATFHRLTYMDNHILTGAPAAGSMNDTVVGRRSNVRSKSQCAAVCLSVESCVSFFYDDDDDACIMHSVLYLGSDEASDKPNTTYWQLSTDDCPRGEGFVLYRPLALCYKYYDQLEYWDTAQNACSSVGTSLLKVNTPDVFQHMYHFLRGSTATRLQHVSIGISEKTGSLAWQDGTPANWVQWMAPNEPSNSLDEKCVNMAWFYYFKWNDVPCSGDDNAKYNFICQKTI